MEARVLTEITSRALCAAVALSIATSCVPDDPAIAQRRSAIIDGTPASERSAVARIAHRDRASTCSATAITSRAVVTAKHCVFAPDMPEDRPLPADGFRVSFGPDDEHFADRFVERLEWIGMPGALGIAEAVALGEDVAIVHLAEPVPGDVAPVDVDLDYRPTVRDALVLVGFGISSLSTRASGVRLEGDVAPTGLDRTTGLVQVEGPAACFGDSGGPLLLKSSGALVGVLGQVGGTSDASFCDTGLSFAATVGNGNVRELLRGVCEELGGCGRLEAIGEDETNEASGEQSAGTGSEIGSDPREASLAELSGEVTREDRLPEESGVDSALRPEAQGGCDCSAEGSRQLSTGRALCLPLFWLLLATRRHRRHRFSKC